MSDEKKQGDENWRDATGDDVAEIFKTGKPKRARVKDGDDGDWEEEFIAGCWLKSSVARWIDLDGAFWNQCQVYVAPAPTRSPKYGCRMLEDNEEPMPGDFINLGAGWHELGEGSFPWVVATPSWFCRPIEATVGKSNRPVPKGFRLLGDEPRLASDGYWSLSCKDWLVIGDRVEEANRDKWPAIRLVVDEPEPVKQLVPSSESVWSPDPTKVRPMMRIMLDPIKDRTIMKIRLPVPASVLGKLGDMLENHYPGSTMRQAGGYLVFEEPIES
jgi:hypothetical protein